MKRKKNRTNFHEDLIESLKDPREAVEYLKAALEESDMPELFLVALWARATITSVFFSQLKILKFYVCGSSKIAPVLLWLGAMRKTNDSSAPQ